MTLAPLLGASLAVQLHAAAVIPAFFTGTWPIFLSRKGAPAHRAIGYLYLALITATSIAALFVNQINPDGPFGFSFIHLFVPLTLVSVAGAVYGLKTRNIVMHKNSMIGAYTGGLAIAGGFALAPGRIMYSVLFG
jgi:uncharacterized membrane protein